VACCTGYAKMVDAKYKTPSLLCVLAFVMTLATSFLVPMSCNHKVTADVVEVRGLEEYGMCRLTLRYVAGRRTIETTKVKECSNGSANSTVRGCYRHWDDGDFFAYGYRGRSSRRGALYIPISGVIAMIVASGGLCVAACAAFALVAYRTDVC
jgi:hypothetical protein